FPPEVPVVIGHLRRLGFQSTSNSGTESLYKLFSRHLRWQKDTDQIPIDIIHQRQRAFQLYLVRSGISRKRRSRLIKQMNLLLKEAIELGWVPDQYLSDEWRVFLPEAQLSRCAELVRHFALLQLNPVDLTRHDVNVWINQHVHERVYSFSTAWQMASQFTTMLLRRGYSKVNPIAAARLDKYGKPLEEFPEPLRTRVKEFISYRTRSADGREDPDEDEEDDWDDDDVDGPMPSTRKQIRAVTAQKLEGAICRLYGFLCLKGHGNVEHVEQLFGKGVLHRYKNWLQFERKLEPWALRSQLNTLIAAAMQQSSMASESVRLARFVRDLPSELEPQR